MLADAAAFLNDAAGLEKVLRFCQSFAQVVVALSVSPIDAAPWIQARSYFVVARRFFRISKWIDAWEIANRHFYSESEDGIKMMLTICKWSCFGMFAFLEMFTITDALKLTATTWGPWVLREAYKFWFYAQVASILLSLYDLLLGWTTVELTVEVKSLDGKVVKVKGSSMATAAEQSVKTKGGMADTLSIFKKLFVDGCDILIPGSTVGWINVDPLTVGVTGCISTAVSMGDIWVRIQTVKAG